MSSSKAGWRADGGLVYNRSTGVRSPPPPPPLPQLALDPCQLAQATIAPTAAAENISLKADCEQSPPSSWAAGRDPTADDETAEALQSARCCCSHRALHRLLLLQRWSRTAAAAAAVELCWPWAADDPPAIRGGQFQPGATNEQCLPGKTLGIEQVLLLWERVLKKRS